MTAAVVRARGLRVAREGVGVVSAVDLDLRRGEVTALLGPNGAGKSTLLLALAGLLPPAGGTLERGGRVAAGLQTAALARRSARANVEAALAWWGVPRAERRERALAALRGIGAGALADRPAGALSGGEARRVHLARALALQPDALLLDEPFAGLDAPTRGELLYDAASALRSERRATLVVVHDRAEAWALADRVAIMLDGRIAAHGPPREVLLNPPSPAVAEFVGFVGRLVRGDEILFVRPADVALADGPLCGRVTRLVPVEEGVRVELDLPEGRLVALAPAPGPPLGADVGVRVSGGVGFSGRVAEPPARRGPGVR